MATVTITAAIAAVTTWVTTTPPDTGSDENSA